MLDSNVRRRLGELSARLGDRDWLDAEFSIGDIMMIGLLRRLKGTALLEEYPNLVAYVVRGEERPAFKRAFDAQLHSSPIGRRAADWPRSGCLEDEQHRHIVQPCHHLRERRKQFAHMTTDTIRSFGGYKRLESGQSLAVDHISNIQGPYASHTRGHSDWLSNEV